MTKTEKKKFIKSLCDSIRDDLVKKVERMPDEWDGHELRELIADLADRERTSSMTGKRKRDYRNEVLVRNLSRIDFGR